MATPKKKIVPDRTDLATFAVGATSGDASMRNGWFYRGGAKSVIGDNLGIVDPNGHFEIAGNTLANAQTAAAAVQARVNLIPNPDFETDASSWIVAGGTFVRSTAQAHTGTASGLLTASGAEAEAAPVGDAGALRMGMLPGLTYTFTAWLYVPTGSGPLASVFLAFLDNDGTGYAGPLAAPTVFDAWNRVSVTRTIRAGATEAFCRVETVAGNGKTVYVDDVSLVRNQ